MRAKFLALLAALTVALAACGGAKPAPAPADKKENTGPAQAAAPAPAPAPAAGADKPEQPEVTLYGVIDAQVSAQQIIAAKKGFFEKNGLKVTNKLVQSGPDIGPLIAGGTAPLSFETNITVISVAANNVPSVIVTPLANIAGTQAVIGKKGLQLKSARDLEGKRIGMVNGAGVFIAIQNMCKELQVDCKKIKFINMSPADQVAALEKGDIDAMAAWEPWVTKAINQGGTFLFSGSKSELPEKKGDVKWMNFHSTFQVSKEFLQKNPKTVAAILKSLKEATEFINKNRAEAVEILAAELKIPKNELEQMMGRNVYSLSADEALASGSKEIAEFMAANKNIPKVPDLKEYTDFSILKQVDASLVKAPF